MAKQLFTTGAVLHRWDPRTITAGEVLAEETVPEEFDTIDLIPGYQGAVPKCVIEAYSYLSRLQDYYETGVDVLTSADAGYIMAKDKYDFNRDYGTSLMTGARVLCDHGLPETKIFPDNEEYWNEPNKYFDIGRWTEAVHDNADIHRKRAYIRAGGMDWAATTADQLQQSIYQRKGAVIIIRGDDNFIGSGTGFVNTPADINNTWYHGITLKGWKNFNGELHFKFANWWDPKQKGNPNGSAFGWLNFNQWRYHIWGAMTTVDALNDEFVKKISMAKLYRDPTDQNEVYAVNNSNRSHVANKYTLEEGAKIGYWIWKEGDTIEVATEQYWKTLIEVAETVFSPRD